MRDFRIALVAQDSPVGVKAQNLARAMEWVRKAKQAGAELVCLPELNITGHAGDSAMVAEAEPVSNGPAVRALLDLAREQSIYICAGIAEDERGIHYNTQFIVGPDGLWGKQRKVHLSADEYFFFRGGTDLPVFDRSSGVACASAWASRSGWACAWAAAWPSRCWPASPCAYRSASPCRYGSAMAWPSVARLL